jgi:GT2 family glycosyltransferase
MVEAGKSRALQWVVEKIGNGFVVFFDDDIRFSASVLEAYSRSVQTYGPKHVYGGPFGVDFEEQPPEWLREYLPLSAGGALLRHYRTLVCESGFLGCNYGVFAEDILDVGGFRLDLGPEAGAPVGEDTDIQSRLIKEGSIVIYIEDAKVWHYIPKERCTPEWAIQRNYRHSLSRILIREELPDVRRRILGLPLGYWKYMAQLHLGLFLAENLAFIIPDKEARFRVRHWAAGTRGYLVGRKRKAGTKTC